VCKSHFAEALKSEVLAPELSVKHRVYFPRAKVKSAIPIHSTNDIPGNLDDVKMDERRLPRGDGDAQLSTLVHQSDSDLSVSFPPCSGLQAEGGEHQPPLAKWPKNASGC